jgi:hypothetical protein
MRLKKKDDTTPSIEDVNSHHADNARLIGFPLGG